MARLFPVVVRDARKKVFAKTSAFGVIVCNDAPLAGSCTCGQKNHPHLHARHLRLFLFFICGQWSEQALRGL